MGGTCNLVGDDGTLTPADLFFSTDRHGLISAWDMLDQSVSPGHRYTRYVTEKKAAAQQAKEAAVFEETPSGTTWQSRPASPIP